MGNHFERTGCRSRCPTRDERVEKPRPLVCRTCLDSPCVDNHIVQKTFGYVVYVLFVAVVSDVTLRTYILQYDCLFG